jgi:hypothetical protein
VVIIVVAVCGSETVWIWLNRCTFAGTGTASTDAGTRRIALAVRVHRLIVQRLFGAITVLVDSEGHCSRYIRRICWAGYAAAVRGPRALAGGLPHQLISKGSGSAKRCKVPKDHRKATQSAITIPITFATTGAASKGATGKMLFETMKQRQSLRLSSAAMRRESGCCQLACLA